MKNTTGERTLWRVLKPFLNLFFSTKAWIDLIIFCPSPSSVHESSSSMGQCTRKNKGLEWIYCFLFVYLSTFKIENRGKVVYFSREKRERNNANVREIERENKYLKRTTQEIVSLSLFVRLCPKQTVFLAILFQGKIEREREIKIKCPERHFDILKNKREWEEVGGRERICANCKYSTNILCSIFYLDIEGHYIIINNYSILYCIVFS